MQGDPEPYVRRVPVDPFMSSRRRRWWGEQRTAELPEVQALDADAPVSVALARDRHRLAEQVEAGIGP